MVGAVEFLTVLVLLYLVECVRKVEPVELIVERGWRGRYRIRRPMFYPGNGEWGWILLHPLRLGPVFLLRPGGVCDARAAGARAKEFDRRARWLKNIAGANAAVWFVVIPALWWTLGITGAVAAGLPAIVLLAAATGAAYGRAARAWGPAVKFVLYPVASLRALDRLSFDALSEFESVAVLAALCGSREAAEEAAKARFGEVGRFAALQQFCEREKLPIEEFSGRPAAVQAGCRTYCPCCRAQYLLAEGRCTDCLDVPLAPL